MGIRCQCSDGDPNPLISSSCPPAEEAQNGQVIGQVNRKTLVNPEPSSSHLKMSIMVTPLARYMLAA